MDRIVVKKNGRFMLKHKSGESEYEVMQRALELLYDYEDTLATPMEVCQLQCEHERDQKIIRQLAEGKLNSMKMLQDEIRRSSGIDKESPASGSTPKPRRLTARDKHSGRAYYLKCFEEPCRGYGCQISNCPLTEQACERLCELEEELWQEK